MFACPPDQEANLVMRLSYSNWRFAHKVENAKDKSVSKQDTFLVQRNKK